LIEQLRALFGRHQVPPPDHMAEFMAAAARVGDAARKAGAEDVDDGGPFGAMAKEMRNGATPKPARKRSKRAA
jgi:hypothetical protein